MESPIKLEQVGKLIILTDSTNTSKSFNVGLSKTLYDKNKLKIGLIEITSGDSVYQNIDDFVDSNDDSFADYDTIKTYIHTFFS